MQSDNPYAAPKMPTLVEQRKEMKIAGQGRRFLNLLLDNVFIQIPSACAGFILGIVYGVMKAANQEPITPADEAQLQLIGMFVGIFIAVGYYVLMEAIFQRTLAKMITGTCVVNSDGGKPSFGQIVGRSFARMIPFEAFSFFGGKGYPVGWHDSLSGTRVITTR